MASSSSDNTGSIFDEFSLMDNTAWIKLCKKYIGELMVEQALTDGTQPDLSRRAAFLMSTLQSHHNCRIGKDLTVVPEGNERSAKSHLREYARKLLKAAGTDDEERDKTNASTTEEVAEPHPAPAPSVAAPPQETKEDKKRLLLSTGKCPVCGEQRKHLRAHLATRKPGHGWSAEKYERWLYEKQAEGRKDRHRMRECPKGCGWSGVKVEMHLEKHHDIEAKSREMAKLKASSKALTREEYSRKWQAGEGTSGASSKKRPQNPMVLESSSEGEDDDRASKLKKRPKRPMVLESSSGSDDDDPADKNVESGDEQDVGIGSDDGLSNAREGQEDSETNGDDEEDCDDDGDDSENLGPYGPSSRPTNVFEVLVRGWNKHLATPDGTEKTPAMIRQMCHHVVTIAKTVDPAAQTLDVFLNKDLVYKRFFKHHLDLRKQDKSQGYCSKTLSCYSTSLQRFLAYALKVMRQGLSSEKREALEDLRDVQRNWREAWGKTIAQQRAEVEWEAEKNLPTPEEIRSIQSSEHVQKLRKMIMQPRRHQLTTEDAVAVRNYLIFLINMENASRAGPVAEITLDTFKNGRMVDDKWTIHIAKQKTTKTTGGLILNFSSDLKLMICSYIDHFRPLLARNGSSNTDAMFLNSTGSPYTNSHVHHALKQFAARTGCLREESLAAFCSSMLRHFVVTNTRGLSSPEKNNLASKMGHSRSTADKWYNLINKMKAASEAHDTVASLLSASGCSSKVAKEQNGKKFHESEPKDERSEKSGMDPKDDEVTLVSGFTDVIPPSETASWGSIRRHWSKEDTDKIMSVCHTEITGAAIPTRTSIIRKLRSNPLTNEMVQIEGAERAYQKVKHMRRNHQLRNTKCTK